MGPDGSSSTSPGHGASGQASATNALRHSHNVRHDFLTLCGPSNGFQDRPFVASGEPSCYKGQDEKYADQGQQNESDQWP